MTRYSVNGDEWYLFTYSTNDNITLRRSRALTDNWDHQETRVVFNPDSRGQDAGQPWSTDIWVGNFSINQTFPAYQSALCVIPEGHSGLLCWSICRGHIVLARTKICLRA